MRRLVINPDTPEQWSRDLTLGEHRIGRDPANDIALEHSSVSGLHCQVSVSENGAFLRDLGSTAGTFINGELVEQVRLTPGATLRIGEIEARYEDDAPAGATTARTGLTSFASAARQMPAHCKSHPSVVARHFCPKCHLGFCDLCVETRMANRVPVTICRKCGGLCEPVRNPDAALRRPKETKLAMKLPEVVGYPLQGSGIFLIIIGGIVFPILSFFPIIGLLITGYLFNYAKSIVTSTAEGREEPPDWPDFTSWWEDILVPYGQMLALMVLSFGPAFVLTIALPNDIAFRWPLIIATGVFGAFLAPMGMMSLAMFDTVTALNPIALVWSIMRIPGAYLLCAIPFLFVVGTFLFLEELLKMVIPWPLLTFAISGFLNIYLLMVSMRIAGLLYATQKQKLGWFSK